MKLYSAPGTCATAMHIVLEWIGAPYEVEQLDFAGMKSEAYLKINPSGVVPTLVDGDMVLPEGLAILLYLADKHSESGIAPAAGTVERAELHRWLAFISGTLHPYFWPHFMPMRFTTDPKEHKAVQQASHSLVDKALSQIEQHLVGRDWLLGDKKSVADALLYPMAGWAYGFDKPTSEYRNIDRIIRKLAADPAVLAVHKSQGTQPKVGLVEAV
ncbi:glutathione S-transferase N-terminal domain-containing protein [Pseudovibrio sp. Tun.PSC04-5.I4]|uniref:glutathione S-transferase family protein n=1 Tax=Pseudovibrio sp. Tun.PSC04-5.I4 TaxID=1798213 RepID=UPI00087EB89A|nr:glutathione S-transferase N-terminal domain-containing protein [Pseudovibrio sp. Tun.PSC04-5.I4]SDR33510.1 glutathione S-transferase [Pseudovibrio sp. Tun.PSC04-5.I4]